MVPGDTVNINVEYDGPGEDVLWTGLMEDGRKLYTLEW